MSEKIISAIGATAVGCAVFYGMSYNRVAEHDNQCNLYTRMLFDMKNDYIKYKIIMPDEEEKRTYDRHIAECDNQIQAQLEWKEKGWFYRSIISSPFPNFIKIDEVGYKRD